MDENEGQVVAEGTSDDGASWSLSARRVRLDDMEHTESGLQVVMRVTSADGLRQGEEGIGGELPSLTGRMIDDIHWGGGTDEPRSFCGYVHPDIRRLTLTTTDGSSVDVPLYDCADFPEVHFAALAMPDDLRFVAVTGYSRDGEQLAQLKVPRQGITLRWSIGDRSGETWMPVEPGDVPGDVPRST
jgi:hypothetical protein